MNDATNAKDIVGKLRVSLVPTALIRAVAEVRAYGTAKYGNPENWTQVDKTYYVDALLRHVLNYIDDPAGVDPESGLPHMAHAACNAAFILAMDGGAKREKPAHETHAPVCDASDAEPVPDGEVPAEPEPQPAEQIRCDARRYIFGLFHIICPNCGKVSDFGVKKRIRCICSRAAAAGNRFRLAMKWSWFARTCTAANAGTRIGYIPMRQGIAWMFPAKPAVRKLMRFTMRKSARIRWRAKHEMRVDVLHVQLWHVCDCTPAGEGAAPVPDERRGASHQTT